MNHFGRFEGYLTIFSANEQSDENCPCAVIRLWLVFTPASVGP